MKEKDKTKQITFFLGSSFVNICKGKTAGIKNSLHNETNNFVKLASTKIVDITKLENMPVTL